MGLSFAVPQARGVKFPSILKNLLKEVKKDIGCKLPSHGNLEKWALQVTIHYFDSVEMLEIGYFDIVVVI